MRNARIFSWSRAGIDSYPNGLFGMNSLRKPDDFPRIAVERVDKAREVMKAWRDSENPDPIKSIGILDDVSNSLCRIADAAEFIRNVHHHSQWIEGATQAVEKVSSFMSEANIDSSLYNRAKKVREDANENLLSSKEHSRVISAMILAMENEGVALQPHEKKELIELQESDLVKSFTIIKSVSENGEVPGEWVPIPDHGRKENWSAVFPQRKNSNGQLEILVPSGQPNLIPHLLRDIDCRTTRQRIWGIANRTTSAIIEKENSLNDLIGNRRRQAEIRGYRSWNEYAQRESILNPLGGPRAVEGFLAELWTDLCPGLAYEMAVLSSLNDGNRVESWDLDFLIHLWKNKNPSAIASTQAIQSKLTFQRILRGGQMVFDKVLGVDLLYDGAAGALWHKDAFRLSLSRGGQEPFAFMYLDPYARETKAVQSAQFTIAGSKILPDGTRQAPQTALVLGLPNDPSIPLPVSVSQTFFHELGHAAHSLLSETHLQHFSGSRGAIDFVEFPSHLFEFFGTDPVCLEAFIGSDVNSSYYQDYARNRNPFAHLEVAQQLAYAMLDQVYYSTGSPSGVFDHLPDTLLFDKSHVMSLLIPKSVANFEHLVHYGGSYYSYLLCRAIAADVWNKSFKQNPFDRVMGDRLERFLRNGSVNQSLESIYGILTDSQPNDTISRQAFIEDLRSCQAIHVTK